MVYLADVLVLLVLFQVKHFAADYLLQGKYMLGKFKPGWDFLGPLTAHAAVHAGFTLIIAALWLDPALGLGPSFGLAILDFVVHFAMDRVKAGPKYLGRFKDTQKPQFWWCLGLDQMVHHLTHYAIIVALVTL